MTCQITSSTCIFITWSLSRCYFLCCVNNFYDWSSELLKLTVKALKLKASGESQPIYIFGPPISTVQQSQGRDTGLGTRDRDDGMSKTKNKNEKLEEGEQTIQMFRSTQLWEWSIYKVIWRTLSNCWYNVNGGQRLKVNGTLTLLPLQSKNFLTYGCFCMQHHDPTRLLQMWMLHSILIQKWSVSRKGSFVLTEQHQRL